MYICKQWFCVLFIPLLLHIQMCCPQWRVKFGWGKAYSETRTHWTVIPAIAYAIVKVNSFGSGSFSYGKYG